jgi:hypothetical protein
MEEKPSLAPGRPGLKPTWTSGAKTGVGAPLSALNHCWFTLSHGIFNGIYYPRLDQACTRDMGLLITDGHDFFSEEKRDCHHEISRLAPDVPAYRLINTCNQGRYRIEKRILADPRRDVVLQWTRFTPLQGSLQDYHVYALLAPHIQNEGYDNTAWLDQYKGTPLLVAERDGRALALGCSTGWLKRSAGYVGTSDGWQDVSRHRAMTWTYERAEEGNVALTGEVDLQAGAGEFVLALGFGDSVSACLRASKSRHDCTFRNGKTGWPTSIRWNIPPSTMNCTASAPPWCGRTRPWNSPARSLPACPSPGARRARPARTSAAITSSGHAIWPWPPEPCWQLAPGRICAAASLTCKARRKRTGTGRSACGATGAPIGRASRWTRPPCRFCSLTWHAGIISSRNPTAGGFGPRCVTLPST